MGRVNEYRFSATTDEILRRAGWSEGRRIDTAGFQASITAQGLFPSNEALVFLGEIGGLRIVYPHRLVHGREEVAILDPAEGRGGDPPKLRRARRINGRRTSLR